MCARKKSKRCWHRCLSRWRQLGTAASVLTNADLKFAPFTDPAGAPLEVAQGTISDLMRESDPALRRAAWESYADGHLGVKNTLAACLSGRVKQSVFSARARNYPSALESSLAPNAIPREVFDDAADDVPGEPADLAPLLGPAAERPGRRDACTCADVPAYAVPAPMPKSERLISFARRDRSCSAAAWPRWGTSTSPPCAGG